MRVPLHREGVCVQGTQSGLRPLKPIQ